MTTDEQTEKEQKLENRNKKKKNCMDISSHKLTKRRSGHS